MGVQDIGGRDGVMETEILELLIQALNEYTLDAKEAALELRSITERKSTPAKAGGGKRF